VQCSLRYALTDSCWIPLLHISVRLKAISSISCVYFSPFTSVIHCSFRLRHFLKKLQKRLLVSSYRSGFPATCLPVCMSVRPHVSTQLTTDRDSRNLCRCVSLTFVARFKFYSSRTNRTDTVHEDMHLRRYKCRKYSL